MNVQLIHSKTPPQSFEVTLKTKHQKPIPGLYRSLRDGTIILASNYDSTLDIYEGIMLGHTIKPLAHIVRSPGYFDLWNASYFTPLEDTVEIRSTNVGGNYPQLAEDSRGGVYLKITGKETALLKEGRVGQPDSSQPSVGELIEGDLSCLWTFAGTVQLSN